MKKAIYKYKLKVRPYEEQVLMMPGQPQFLFVGEQNGYWGEICLWVLVEIDAPLQPQTLWVFGTGDPIDQDQRPITLGNYIGSVQMSDRLVWHVFYRARFRDLGQD